MTSFTIQDYLDMWENMRSQSPKSDMINRPGSTDGCWIWRCHKRMEDLIDNSKFNDFVKNMLKVINSNLIEEEEEEEEDMVVVVVEVVVVKEEEETHVTYREQSVVKFINSKPWISSCMIVVNDSLD